MTATVGVLVGRESSFPPALIEAVNRRGEGVTAALVKVGTPALGDPAPYDVIIDRISHQVPFYRTWLMHAIVHGARVINDPFSTPPENRFLTASLASRLGIRTPGMVLLPHKEHAPSVNHPDALRNLDYPLDWEGVVRRVGVPCVLREAEGMAGRRVHICRSPEELLGHYDQSGQRLMLVQEYVEWERFIRCVCVGRTEVVAVEFSAGERRFPLDQHPGDRMGRWVVEQSRRLSETLEWDLCSVDWAVRGEEGIAIDINPTPVLDAHSLSVGHFEEVVHRVAELALRLAKSGRGG